MKKLLLLIPFLLFAFTSKYTPDLNGIVKNLHCNKVLHKTAFDICYNCYHKEPNAVAYVITREMVKSKSYIRDLTFHTDYSLPRICRSYTSNYTHSGYDRGHNAPNTAFNYNKSIQKQTFLMSNVAPQAKWLNRKYWAKVEKLARYLAVKYGKVEVITGNFGSKGHLKNNVNIPAYWYKIIYIPHLRMQPLVFLAPNINKGMKTANVRKYKTTLKKLKEFVEYK